MTEKPYSETSQNWEGEHFQPLNSPKELTSRIRYGIAYQAPNSSLKAWCASYTLTENILESLDVVFDTSQNFEGQMITPGRTYHPKVVFWRGAALIIPISKGHDDQLGEAESLQSKGGSESDSTPSERSR